MIGRPASRALALPLLIMCLCSPAAALGANKGPVQPHQLIRMLSADQNRIVHGDRAAFETLQMRFVETSNAMLSADMAVWSESPSNIRAAIKLALGGGPADVLIKLVKAKLIAEPYIKLAAAAVAFAVGRKTAAHKYLKDIDHRKLDPSLGGHVALVKALLGGNRDKGEIFALLDDACLLSPGTIVEEAALRRHAPAVEAAGNLKRFEALILRYFRRFPNSLYANGLLFQVGTALAQHDYGNTPSGKKIAEKVLSLLTTDRQHALLSNVVKESLARGHIATAKFALEKKSALPPSGVADLQADRLYSAATLILTDEFEAGVGALSKVDQARLARSDRELAEVTAQLIKSIQETARTPDEQEREHPVEKSPASSAETNVRETVGGEVVDVGRRLVDSVDKYLAELGS